MKCRFSIYVVIFILHLFQISKLIAQDPFIDSLKLVMKSTKHDTTRCRILSLMIEAETNDDLWPKYNEQLRQIAEYNLKNRNTEISIEILYKTYLADAFNNIAFRSRTIGDTKRSEEYYHKCLKLYKELKLNDRIANTYNGLGYLYDSNGEISKALEFFNLAFNASASAKMPDGSTGDKKAMSIAINNIGLIYKSEGDIQKAMLYLNKCLRLSIESDYKEGIATSYNNLAQIYKSQGNVSVAIEYFNKGLQLYKEIKDKEGIAVALVNIGLIYESSGDTKSALTNFKQGLKIYREVNNMEGIATALDNVAHVYMNQGDYSHALEFIGNSLKIREAIGNKVGIANSLNNLAIMLEDQGEIQKSLEYNLKSLSLRKELREIRGIAQSHNNIGHLFYKRKEYKKALEHYFESLKMREEIKEVEGIGYCLNNIGVVYEATGSYSIASAYYVKALTSFESISFMKGQALCLHNISSLHLRINNYQKAMLYATKSMQIALKLGSPQSVKNSAGVLFKLNKINGNYKDALKNYELFITMRDSINSDESRKASIKSQLKYEYEKQAAADSVAHAKESEIKNAEIAKQTAEIRAKKNQQYALFGGLGLVIIFAGFMYNRFKVTQKQKGIIEEQKLNVEAQKHLVEEKQKEILDSIRYAQRIQKAHLPSESYIKMNLIKNKH